MTGDTHHSEELQSEPVAEPLKFYSDKGAERSKWIAGLLVLILVGWMGSGFIFPSEKIEKGKPAAEKVKLFSVAVKPSIAKPITTFFIAEGQALPDRETVIKAEISGNIAQLAVKKGELVNKDQILAKFDAPQIEAEMKRAEEDLRRNSIDLKNAEKLLKQGVSTTKRVNDAKTAMAAAEAQVSNAKEALKSVEIKAPFSGRLETLSIALGEFVQAGSEIGRVVDNNPLTINIQIPQQSLNQIVEGQVAAVDFITGEKVKGEVTFVSKSANAETRTFLAEIAIDNSDGKIPAGVSAKVKIPTAEVRAHFVSPAILSLNTQGILGVKTVDEQNKVVFSKIDIIRAETDGVWVRGLRDEVNLITIGQGFVKNGEEVIAASQEILEQAAKTKQEKAN